MTENTERTTDSSPDESGWVECPGGEISGMVDRLARQQKLAVSAKISAVAACLLVGAGIWFSLPGTSADPTTPRQANVPEGEYQFGSVCCSEVAEYAAAFREGTLDEAKSGQIRQHIASCPNCGKAFEKAETEPQTSTNQPPVQVETAALSGPKKLIAAL